jgi:hypothetical protein
MDTSVTNRVYFPFARSEIIRNTYSQTPCECITALGIRVVLEILLENLT